MPQRQGSRGLAKQAIRFRGATPRPPSLLEALACCAALHRAAHRPASMSPAGRAQVSTNVETMYFVADNDKDKEDWINSIGRAIVRHSASLQENEVMNY